MATLAKLEDFVQKFYQKAKDACYFEIFSP
jgi:hypothetical protein